MGPGPGLLPLGPLSAAAPCKVYVGKYMYMYAYVHIRKEGKAENKASGTPARHPKSGIMADAKHLAIPQLG